MSKEIQVLADGVFQIVTTDTKTGKVKDAEKLHADVVLNRKQIGSAISQAVKTQGTMRNAWLSFLSVVLVQQNLSGYRGQGDRKTGKLATEFKASVRNAEESAIRELVAEGALKLPKAANEESAFQQFVRALRLDKNYSNAKNLASRYFAFVGNNVVTDSGHVLPAPVMTEAIASVLECEEPDNTIAAKLAGVELLMNEKGNADTPDMDADDAQRCVAILKRMLSTTEGIVRYYAEMATAKRGNPTLGVPGVVEEVLALAKGEAQPA